MKFRQILIGCRKSSKQARVFLIDDGAIELVCRIRNRNRRYLPRRDLAVLLAERKGINLPNTPLPIPSMTEKDHADLMWAMEQNVDYIALSFVRTADDCKEVKDIHQESK